MNGDKSLYSSKILIEMKGHNNKYINIDMDVFKGKNETRTKNKNRRKKTDSVGLEPLSQRCIAVKRTTYKLLCDLVTLSLCCL